MAGGPDLLLVPTEPERSRIAAIAGPDVPAHLCGFGPVLAAARTRGLVATLRPRRVILVGIAGTLRPDRLAVGAATTFGAVALHGVGSGRDGRSSLPQWPGDDRSPRIEDRLPLADPGPDLLLTVCRSAEGPDDVADRRRRFADAVAEDMEAFGVAAACALDDVPLHVVRGVSNVAGDRDHARWEVDAALAAAWERVQALTAETDG